MNFASFIWKWLLIDHLRTLSLWHRGSVLDKPGHLKTPLFQESAPDCNPVCDLLGLALQLRGLYLVGLVGELPSQNKTGCGVWRELELVLFGASALLVPVPSSQASLSMGPGQAPLLIAPNVRRGLEDTLLYSDSALGTFPLVTIFPAPLAVRGSPLPATYIDVTFPRLVLFHGEKCPHFPCSASGLYGIPLWISGGLGPGPAVDTETRGCSRPTGDPAVCRFRIWGFSQPCAQYCLLLLFSC